MVDFQNVRIQGIDSYEISTFYHSFLLPDNYLPGTELLLGPQNGSYMFLDNWRFIHPGRGAVIFEVKGTNDLHVGFFVGKQSHQSFVVPA